MAAVYKAYHASMDRYVALKILPRHFASDPEFVGRFSQEAKVIANLQHPHILPVHDFGEADGYTYLVMRFIEGGTLSDWLGPRTPLTLAKIRSVVSQVGGALEYAHARGVIHRDIKPSNILVDQWDNCLLTDFGLAKMIEGSSYLTQTGGILGTPAYMSPEQGLGQKVDHRSDIYSLGVVLYQMAVGHLPYQAETPMAVVIKHIHDPLPPPRQRDPNLPEAIERIILKSLAKNPEHRFADAGALVKALRSATEAPTVAKVAPAAEEVAPPPAEAVTPPELPPTPVPTEVIPPSAEESEPVVESVEAPTATPELTEVLRELEPTEALPPPAEERRPARERAKPRAAPPSPPAVSPRPKSKLPWILAGVGAIVILGVIALLAGDFLSGGDEEDQQDVVAEVVDEPGVAEDERPQDEPEEVEQERPPEPVEEPPPEPEDEVPPPESEELLLAVDAILEQVDIAYMEEDPVRAKELLDQAIELAPDAAELRCQRGYTMRDLEEWHQAAADFEHCWILAEEHGERELQGEGRAMLAMTQAEIAMFEEDSPELAFALLDEALSDPITPGWLHCERAEYLLMMEQPQAAIEGFEMCKSTDELDEYWSRRSQAAIFQIQGEMAQARDDYQGAAENFSQWVELEPEDPWAHCLLGDAYLNLEAYEQSTAAFERCRQLTEDPEAHGWAEVGIRFVAAQVAIANEQWDEALALFDAAIEAAPDDAWLFCERASFYIFLHAADEALSDIEICRELGADDPGIIEWTEGLMVELEESGG
jgi:serine/threonine protein kinase/tetratricopeptide (TPR) repeat protein